MYIVQFDDLTAYNKFLKKDRSSNWIYACFVDSL